MGFYLHKRWLGTPTLQKTITLKTPGTPKRRLIRPMASETKRRRHPLTLLAHTNRCLSTYFFCARTPQRLHASDLHLRRVCARRAYFLLLDSLKKQLRSRQQTAGGCGTSAPPAGLLFFFFKFASLLRGWWCPLGSEAKGGPASSRKPHPAAAFLSENPLSCQL